MTLDELKEQRRWVLWRLETVHGKQTKVPYRPDGRKAMANNPETWHTHAECAALAHQFSGVGVVLGVTAFGAWTLTNAVTLVTGKFTPESRRLSLAWTATANTARAEPAVTCSDLARCPDLDSRNLIPDARRLRSNRMAITSRSRGVT